MFKVFCLLSKMPARCADMKESRVSFWMMRHLCYIFTRDPAQVEVVTSSTIMSVHLATMLLHTLDRWNLSTHTWDTVNLRQCG